MTVQRSAPAHRRPQHGSTLIELIVVLLALVVLVVFAIHKFDQVRQDSLARSVQARAESIARNANALAASDGTPFGAATVNHITTAARETSLTQTPTGGAWLPGDTYRVEAAGFTTLKFVSGSSVCYAVVALTSPAPPNGVQASNRAWSSTDAQLATTNLAANAPVSGTRLAAPGTAPGVICA